MSPPAVSRFAQVWGLPPAGLAALEALLADGAAQATFAPDGSVHMSEPASGPAAHGPPAPGGAVPDRYEDLGRIGIGGMGEVRRVRDRELGRTCALKVIRADLSANPSVAARFAEEAQVAAQLQHPSIPPVYDAGRMADGRLWFTMKEVHGQTLGRVIRAAHATAAAGGALNLHRLVDAFCKVCDGVGYAHARGVVHRDLKPDNVMIGDHGEVLVLDWGLSKIVGRPDRVEHGVVTTRSSGAASRTAVGGVLGTAAYMPPEQARGEVGALDARSDVYALGAILYEVLSGRPPYEGTSPHDVLRKVLAGPPDELEGAPLPEELVALCMRCLARRPSDRPADGAAVGAEARAWLDGARVRERALGVVASADAVIDEVAALGRRAEELRAAGAVRLAEVAPWEPEERKAAGWALEDEADELERRATLLGLAREGLLQGALTHAPDLAEAHAALAEMELERHRAAEATRDADLVARAELRLREHVEALPTGHEVARRVATYLRGDGALTLETDPDGAEVELRRFELRNRRLIEVSVRILGRTPLVRVPLPMGSYVCVVRHPERAPLRVPVAIGRGEHWDGVAPGERTPRPLRLTRPGELGDDDRRVAAGWFWSGGDPDAMDGLPRGRLWCDDVVFKRFPVTHREYLAFLDDLVARGREDEALCHAPRERAAIGEGAVMYGRDASGRFALRPDADGDLWHPDWPVFLVDWYAARAYAAWMAERTGQPWRLPGELEWEKAARGVDGRFYPWGDFLDPSWCCVRASHRGRLLVATVDRYPVDESVYGVRGLGGNVQDWCADAYRREGPSIANGAVMPAEATESDAWRVLRGGVWSGGARYARGAHRGQAAPRSRLEYVGFRLARSSSP